MSKTSVFRSHKAERKPVNRLHYQQRLQGLETQSDIERQFDTERQRAEQRAETDHLGMFGPAPLSGETERRVWSDTVLGAVVGMVVCAPFALLSFGGLSLTGRLLTLLLCGAFAGTTVGALIAVETEEEHGDPFARAETEGKLWPEEGHWWEQDPWDGDVVVSETRDGKDDSATEEAERRWYDAS